MSEPKKVAGGYEHHGQVIWRPDVPHLASRPWYIGPRCDRVSFRRLRDAVLHVERTRVLDSSEQLGQAPSNHAG